MHDDVIMRTIIDLPDAEVEALARICARQKISRAEAIRRAVDSYVKSHAEVAGEAFGMWRGRGIDGRRYEDELRDEWKPRQRRR
jgi:hypothetical protein